MATLQDDRYQEIAQWVNDIYRNSPGATKTLWKKGLKDAGFLLSELATYGFAFSERAYALNRLIQGGAISSAEANAFLLQVFPQSGFTGGKFGDVKSQSIEEELNDASAGASGDPANVAAKKEALAKIVIGGIGSGNSNDTLGPPVSVSIREPKIPESYDQNEMALAFRSVAQQVSIALTSQANGNIRFPTGTIPGPALQPGTVPATAMDPISLARAYRDLPGPDSALLVRTAPDYSTDRFFQKSDGVALIPGIVGPGRCRRVTRIDYPDGFQPVPGPMRYRIVVPDMRFGVFSLNQISGGLRVTYGLVIRDIPHFLGRIPSTILYTAFVGDPPTPMVGARVNFSDATTDPTRFFHGTGTLSGRAYDDFVQNPKLAWQPYGPTGAPYSALRPTSEEANSSSGVGFMLIAGRTSEEVYAQMNSLGSSTFAHILGNSRGPQASSPDDVSFSSPCPASVVGIVGIVSHSFLSTDTAASLGGPGAWTVGVPFGYDDCQRLVAREDRFSLYVVPTANKGVVAGTTLPSFSEWDTIGIQAVETNGRKLAVDIVIA